MLSYNFYWIAVITGFLSMLYYERRGHWPFLKAGKSITAIDDSDSERNESGRRRTEDVLTSGYDAGTDGPEKAKMMTAAVRNVEG